MKLNITDARAWYLAMLTGLLVGVALAMNVPHIVHANPVVGLLCDGSACFA